MATSWLEILVASVGPTIRSRLKRLEAGPLHLVLFSKVDQIGTSALLEYCVVADVCGQKEGEMKHAIGICETRVADSAVKAEVTPGCGTAGRLAETG